MGNQNNINSGKIQEGLFINLPTFSIVILFFLLAVTGLFLIKYIPFQVNPSPNSHTLTINFTWPNNTPITIEQEITTKLEGVISTIRGLKEIKSISKEGYGSIEASFDSKDNLSKYRLELATLIKQVYPQLPKGSSYPKIVAKSIFLVNPLLITYAISGLSELDLIEHQINNNLIPQFNSIPAIDRIEVHGNPKKILNIEYDDLLLQQLKISINEVKQKVFEFYNEKKLGAIIENGKSYFINVGFNKTYKIEHYPIAKRNGKIIYLSDVAALRFIEKQNPVLLRVNGLNTITLSFFATNGTNHLIVGEKIKSIVKKISNNHGFKLKVEKIYDNTEVVSEKLNEILTIASFSILALLIFIFLFFSKIFHVLIVLSCIIANLLISCIFYFLFNIELHLYAVAGITISIGLVLDNIIISINHIEKRGDLSFYRAMLAATLTTIIPLSLTYFLDNSYKTYVLDFAKVFNINLTVSLIISLILVPALHHQVVKSTKNKSNSTQKTNSLLQYYEKLLHWLAAIKPAIFLMVIFTFGIPIHLLPDEIEGENLKSIQRLYNRSLGNEYFKNKLKPSISKYLGGTLHLFVNTKKNYYFNTSQKDLELSIFIKMAKGTPIQGLDAVLSTFEKLLTSAQQVRYFVSKSLDENNGKITAYLDRKHANLATPYELKGKLINRANGIGNATCTIVGIGTPFSNQVIGTYLEHAVEISGSNYDKLMSIAFLTKKRLLGHSRISEVHFTDSRNHIPSDQSSLFLNYIIGIGASGIRKEHISTFIEKNNHQPEYFKGTNNGKQFQVAFTLKNKPNSVWGLKNSLVKVDSNRHIKLGHHIEIKRKTGSFNVKKTDKQYNVLLEFNFLGERRHAKKEIIDIITDANDNLPKGYKIISPDFEQTNNSEEEKKLPILISGSVIAIFFICAILFNSFLKPLLILSMIPISFIGIFLSTYFFNFQFDYGGYTSFLVTGGITVNAAIFITDNFIKIKNTYKNISNMEAYIETFKQKFSPITLTTISTIIGLSSFAFSTDHLVFWKALSICTISGAIFSWIGLVVILPLFFKLEIS